MVFDKHIFICINERKDGRLSCGESNGLELVAAFKKRLLDKKLPIKIRAQKAGCLDICNYGPTLVIYPDGVFYVGVTVNDVEEIIEQHIVQNKPVQRLLLETAKSSSK